MKEPDVIGLFPADIEQELKALAEEISSISATANVRVVRGGVRKVNGAEEFSYLKMTLEESEKYPSIMAIVKRFEDLFQVREAWKQERDMKWTLASRLYEAAQERDALCTFVARLKRSRHELIRDYVTWLDARRRSSAA